MRRIRQLRMARRAVVAALAVAGLGVAVTGGLANGNHTFKVEAQIGNGPMSSPATRNWTVDTTVPVISHSFAVTGNASQLFYPGGSHPLNLTITNPFNFSIKVVSLSVNVQSATTRNGQPNPNCSGPQNLTVARPFSGSVIVPAKSTKSLADLSVPQAQWPVMRMLDLPTNQDACKNTAFKLSYSGTATKP
jgi:hypothetical protein